MTSAAKKAKLLRADERRVERKANQLESQIQRWMDRLKDEMTRDALRELKTGRIGVSKAETISDAELLRILTDFGIRQVDETAGKTATALGGEWVIPPQLIRDIIRASEVKIQNLRADIEQEIKEKVRKVMLEANRMKPAPSQAQRARMIRETIGEHLRPRRPGDPNMASRAARVARVESKLNESLAIHEGMQEAGVEMIEWLSSSNPDHGKRRHQDMDGMKVKLGEMFTNPTTGRKLRFPGDPMAHISETAGCGCTYAPVFEI